MLIERLNQENVTAIIRRDGGNGWTNSPDTWASVVSETETGARTVLITRSGDEVCGYGSLVWQSAYPAFSLEGIPEIHDLVTAQTCRGQGVATGLIAEFEQMAAQRGCLSIGLGVGLYADYGPAQRLYASLGFAPDGHGVTYKNQPVVPGSSWPVDDHLVLWLTKNLR